MGVLLGAGVVASVDVLRACQRMPALPSPPIVLLAWLVSVGGLAVTVDYWVSLTIA